MNPNLPRYVPQCYCTFNFPLSFQGKRNRKRERTVQKVTDYDNSNSDSKRALFLKIWRVVNCIIQGFRPLKLQQKVNFLLILHSFDNMSS